MIENIENKYYLLYIYNLLDDDIHQLRKKGISDWLYQSELGGIYASTDIYDYSKIDVIRCYKVYGELIPNLMTFEQFLRDSKINSILENSPID